MTMRTFTWNQVRASRLARAHLTTRTNASIAEVASTVGGIHAQVMSAAETSLGVRIDGLKIEDVRAALWKERTIVKTWTLRGTLHLHAAEELPIWLAARSTVTPGFHDRTLEFHGLNHKKAEALTVAVGEALRDRCLLREELADEVAQKVGSWAREPLMSGWGTMLGLATLRGWLCHGEPRGTKVTFTRADQWVRDWKAHNPNEALRWVARRYIAQFGPVTHSSFHAWFNGPTFKVSGARQLFEELGDEIQQVEVEGKKMWMLGDSTLYEDHPAPVRFLPLYDCLLTGFRERERILVPPAAAFAKTHPKGKLEGPVAVQWLLIDGYIGATWSRTVKGRDVLIDVTPFVKLTKTLKGQIVEEAEILAAFWGLNGRVEVSYKT